MFSVKTHTLSYLYESYIRWIYLLNFILLALKIKLVVENVLNVVFFNVQVGIINCYIGKCYMENYIGR